MGEVVDILSYKPHYSGPAICLHCKHEWQVVCPAPPPASFECPECELIKGVSKGLCAPADDTNFVCNCGHDRFMVLETGIFCEFCGTRTPFYELMSEE